MKTTKNVHFVYAMLMYLYPGSGAVICVGHSSLDTFATRFRGYISSCSQLPILLGVICCSSKRHACTKEQWVLRMLGPQKIPTNKQQSEHVFATKVVMDFIQTHFEDGEAFLKMSAYEFYLRESRVDKDKSNRIPKRRFVKARRISPGQTTFV